MIRLTLLSAMLVLLVSCGPAEGESDGVGGLTAAQADALNRAAARVDAQDAPTGDTGPSLNPAAAAAARADRHREATRP